MRFLLFLPAFNINCQTHESSYLFHGVKLKLPHNYRFSVYIYKKLLIFFWTERTTCQAGVELPESVGDLRLQVRKGQVESYHVEKSLEGQKPSRLWCVKLISRKITFPSVSWAMLFNPLPRFHQYSLSLLGKRSPTDNRLSELSSYQMRMCSWDEEIFHFL